MQNSKDKLLKPSDDELLTTARAARILGVNYHTVARYCRAGKLASTRGIRTAFGNPILLIKRSDVLRIRDERAARKHPVKTDSVSLAEAMRITRRGKETLIAMAKDGQITANHGYRQWRFSRSELETVVGLHDSDLIASREAARILGMSWIAVVRMHQRGKLYAKTVPFRKDLGRHKFLFRKSDILKLKESRNQIPAGSIRIPGHRRCFATLDGRIFSHSQRGVSEIKGYLDARGRKVVRLYDGNAKKGYALASIIARTFFGHSCGSGRNVRIAFKDGDQANCAPSNLKFDKVRRRSGIDAPGAKLTGDERIQILRDRQGGMSLRQIAMKHGVTRTTVAAICYPEKSAARRRKWEALRKKAKNDPKTKPTTGL